MEGPSALLSLPPELAHHVLKHLAKRDKQQFALCCKHAYLCALAAIKALVLGHKCLRSQESTTTKPAKLKMMKYCTSVTLRPRTMDELTNVAALLLVNNLHHLPNMTSLRLELLNVYDKQCDFSLILKSVVLHAKQLTELSIERDAQLSLKALAAAAELPLLEKLELKSRNGFEPGALGQLSRAVNITSLHLEVLHEAASSSTAPLSPSAAASAAAALVPAKSPSELARLQAADEVGLAKMGGQLQSLTAIGFNGSCSSRPITALLTAVAGSPKPRLTSLQLGGGEMLSQQALSLIASIGSLNSLRLLPGVELASALDLSRLSALGGLTQLVAPIMAPPPVLAAWSKGCRSLSSLAVCGQPGPLPLAPPLTGITCLQLLPAVSSRSRTGSSAGAPSSPSSLSGDLAGSLAITLRSPLSLSGLQAVWPRLVTLSVAGWALDAVSVLAIKQLEGLTSISLQGGREPGTALHARLLLPLLDKPGLQCLVLLEVSDLNDAWMSDAMQLITAPTTTSSSSSTAVFSAVRELHLGAATDSCSGPRSLSTTGSGGGRSTAGSISSSTPGSIADTPFSAAGSEDIYAAATANMLTDKGLSKLCAWPRLSHLELVGHPSITLAGVKALVSGCNSLSEMHIRGCPAVSAAPPDSICKAAVGMGGRAVDLWVS